jgi:hypothetical protein
MGFPNCNVFQIKFLIIWCDKYESKFLTPWQGGWIIKDEIGLGLAYSRLSRLKKIDLNKLYLYMLSYKKREMGCYNR